MILEPYHPQPLGNLKVDIIDPIPNQPSGLHQPYHKTQHLLHDPRNPTPTAPYELMLHQPPIESNPLTLTRESLCPACSMQWTGSGEAFSDV